VGKIIYRDIPVAIKTPGMQISFEIKDDVIYKTMSLCRDHNIECSYRKILEMTIDRILMQHKYRIVKHFKRNQKCVYPRIEITEADVKQIIMIKVLEHSN